MPKKSFLTVAQPESTESWRRNLWDVHARYQDARTRRRRLETIEPNGQVRNLEHLLAVACREESEALAEYVWLIKLGTGLRARRTAMKELRLVERLEDGDDGDSNFGC